jgi:hypothetical protein
MNGVFLLSHMISRVLLVMCFRLFFWYCEQLRIRCRDTASLALPHQSRVFVLNFIQHRNEPRLSQQSADPLFLDPAWLASVAAAKLNQMTLILINYVPLLNIKQFSKHLHLESDKLDELTVVSRQLPEILLLVLHRVQKHRIHLEQRFQLNNCCLLVGFLLPQIVL